MDALNRFSPHAHWLLRIPLVTVFLYHGLGKWFALGATAEMMGGLPMALVAATLETGGALLILAGGLGLGGTRADLLSRIGGLCIVPVMIGAIAMVHWPRWSFTPSDTHPMGGMEFQVSMLLLGLYFVVVGNATSGRTAAAAAQSARPAATA